MVLSPINRRTFVGALAAAGAVVACGQAPAPEPTAAPKSAAPAKEPAKAAAPGGSERDPFGVENGVTVEANYFQGGWGIDFLKNIQTIFEEMHPATKINPSYVTRQSELLRTRFVGGNPPDVIYNGGAGSLDVTALVTEGALQPLDDVLEAPALDTPGAKVKDTLVARSQDLG
ncbi:MAG TPA: twin-arginine translocation signal domain-containing protein, partial [Chloroflexota bacterium]